jgi:alginate O-acetyltransferase complex protein AlgJ
MKKRVCLFLIGVLLVLSIVPLANVITIATNKKPHVKWWEDIVFFDDDFSMPFIIHILYPLGLASPNLSGVVNKRSDELYSIDFALPFIDRLFYRLGISTDPSNVIVGKNNWLYAGDLHEKTLTVSRRQATAEDIENAKKIGVATQAWSNWLQRKGVKLYRIMIAPNSSTIYPEFLPNWVQTTSTNSVTDALFANVSPDIYFDTRQALLRAKSQFTQPLYYRTDSHWNNLGAWVAFHAFTNAIARTENDLHWFSEKNINISDVTVRNGGDLASVLSLQFVLQDSEVAITINTDHPVTTEQYDFGTGHLIASGRNFVVEPPKNPILVKSKYALNQKKVLWIHDSFGSAIRQFMVATFSETLQLPWGEMDNTSFIRLVNIYKPDYVFVTIAERNIRKKWFMYLSPEDESLSDTKR